jgi:hypothetical protein
MTLLQMGFEFDRLIITWKRLYFLEAITIVVALFFIMQLISNKGSFLQKSIAILYFISICILFISSAFLNLIIHNIYLVNKYVEILNMWFNCIELYVFFKIFTQTTYPIPLSKSIVYLVYLLIIIFFIISITFFYVNVENYSKYYRPILKVGELVDVLKRCFICVPCFYYFLKLFNTNSSFQINEVLVVFSIFTYCVFGILSYSIATNITAYPDLKRIIMAFPAFALLFVCFSLTAYTKNIFQELGE